MILINLLPPELKRKEVSKLVLPEIPIKKTLITVGVGFVAIQALASLAALGVMLHASGMKREITSLSEDLRETKKIKAQTVSAQNKVKDIRTLTEKKFYWASVLNALTESATKGVWLRSLALTEGITEAPKRAAPAPAKAEGAAAKKAAAPAVVRTKIMRLEGSVYAPGQETAYIGKFVKSLKDNETLKNLFSGIELSSTNQRKISDYDVFDFVLMCQFKKEKT